MRAINECLSKRSHFSFHRCNFFFGGKKEAMTRGINQREKKNFLDKIQKKLCEKKKKIRTKKKTLLQLSKFLPERESNKLTPKKNIHSSRHVCALRWCLWKEKGKV